MNFITNLTFLILLPLVSISCNKDESQTNKLTSEQKATDSSSSTKPADPNNPNNLPIPGHEIAKSIKAGPENKNYIPWDELKGLKLSKGDKKKKIDAKIELSEKLKEIIGTQVKLVGFMVPLDYDEKTIKEFLLIPNPMSCLHVPPPPPNQMVLVKMKKDSQVKYHWGPIWAEGILKTAKEKDLDEEMPSFELAGIQVTNFDQSKLSGEVQKTIKTGSP